MLSDLQNVSSKLNFDRTYVSDSSAGLQTKQQKTKNKIKPKKVGIAQGILLDFTDTANNTIRTRRNNTLVLNQIVQLKHLPTNRR